jgi:molybdopterin-containing oxidoreductase family membrane subunit
MSGSSETHGTLVPLQDPPAELVRKPLVENLHGFAWISDKIAGVAEGKTPRWWWMLFIPSCMVMCMCFAMITYLISTGVGVWGLGHPVFWGWAIVNFVFWIGIGHAGTLISAILFLLRQRWRTAVNRAAEAMTIFAVMCAGIYPGIHVGRAWLDWWMFPIPNSNNIWPQFRSPLMWDVFAVSTYFTVSLMFWYMGLIPDMATMRDRAKTRIRKFIYGFFALGWTGSNRAWSHYEKAYLLLAGLSTPLVLSVHSIVSFDFAVSQLPGWHTTIFPPYFVAGAIFSGFGMVLTLLIPVRSLCKLQEVITVRHIELMGKVILATGSIVGYSYAMEFFIAYYSGNPYELAAFKNRAFGPYCWAYWIMITCNVISPQLFWFKKIRTNMVAVFILSIAVNIGMWFERFVIIVTSLHRDFLPSSWGYYSPTMVDILTFVGTFGLFLTLFLLFLRFVPLIAIAEVKSVIPQGDPEHPLASEKETYQGALPVAVSKTVDHTGKSPGKLLGMLAEFETSAEIKHAATKVRDAGYKKWDVFTPFPIHGMDDAMGLKDSRVGWFTFLGGLTGFSAGMLMIWFMNGFDYPLAVGGKPLFSPVFGFPVSYELTILLGAIGSLGGMLLVNRLPRWHNPVFNSDRFTRATHDRFFVLVECRDPKYSETETRALMQSAGAHHIELVEA